MFFEKKYIQSCLFFLAFLTLFHAHPDHRLILLVDEIKTESLFSSKIEAVTLILNQAIKQQAGIILVSQHILHNYVARLSYSSHPAHPENLSLKGTPFWRSDWRLFEINETSYYLLIPNKYLTAKKAAIPENCKTAVRKLGLRFGGMEEKTQLLPISGDYYKELRLLLKSRIATKNLCSEELTSIFISKRSPFYTTEKWTIYCLGHGSDNGTSSAGMSTLTLQNFLDFIDMNMSINIFYVTSCFLGGKNKYNLLRASKEPYSFTLAVGSLGDYITVINSGAQFESFFSKAATFCADAPDFSDKAAALLQPLTPRTSSTWSSHGISTLPQILMPGLIIFKPVEVYGFTVAAKSSLATCSAAPLTLKATLPDRKTIKKTLLTPTPHTVDIKIIPDEKTSEFVATAATAYSSSVVDLKQKSALLIYEETIAEELHVYPSPGPISTTQKSPLSFVLTPEKLLTESLLLEKETTSLLPATASILHYCEDIVATDSAPSSFKDIMENLCPENMLFPLFVSATDQMNHHLRSIRVINNANGIPSPFFGIFRFLRDSFFDAGYRSSKKVFFIDKIQGYNDLSLFYELATVSNPLAECLPLDSHIQLDHVTVTTEGHFRGISGQVYLEIGFIFNHQAWILIYQGPLSDFSSKNNWTFQPHNTRAYLRYYDKYSKLPETTTSCRKISWADIGRD